MGTWAVARLLQVKALEICTVASRVGQYGGGGWGAATGKGVGLLGRGGSIARQGWSVAASEDRAMCNSCVTRTWFGSDGRLSVSEKTVAGKVNTACCCGL